LLAGDYQVEIIDDVGNNGFYSVTIEDPEPLNLEVNVDWLSATATPMGGTPPLLVKWELPEVQYGTTADLQGIPPGLYFVELTDTKNCEISTNFIFQNTSSIAELSNGSISLYPNPVTAENEFYLEFNLTQNEQIGLFVFNTLGKKVFEESVRKEIGKSTLAIPTEMWTKGVYIITIETGRGEVISQKLIVE